MLGSLPRKALMTSLSRAPAIAAALFCLCCTLVAPPAAAQAPGGSSVYLSDKELLEAQSVTDDGLATFLDARGERDHVFPPAEQVRTVVGEDRWDAAQVHALDGVEGVWRGALEAVDRLLAVADGKDRAMDIVARARQHAGLEVEFIDLVIDGLNRRRALDGFVSSDDRLTTVIIAASFATNRLWKIAARELNSRRLSGSAVLAGVDPWVVHFFCFFLAVWGELTPPTSLVAAVTAKIADASFMKTLMD